jgi:hypothetical protein
MVKHNDPKDDIPQGALGQWDFEQNFDNTLGT